jgi:hypothetical protein
MQELRGKIKIPECARLETLPEGVELIVKSIKEVDYRKKRRYILEFENMPSLYRRKVVHLASVVSAL